MKERPIIFSAAMVCAILAGRNTQTRRVVKPQPVPHNFGPGREQDAFVGTQCVPGFHAIGVQAFNRGEYGAVRCPYGVPGDRLWVRETWWHPTKLVMGHAGHRDADMGEVLDREQPTCYRADAWYPEGGCYVDHATKPRVAKWRPSIHMPRWASRLTLEIVSVRVERLQSISRHDAFCEGVIPEDADRCWDIRSWMDVWVRINGQASWDANPWVWALTFRRVP